MCERILDVIHILIRRKHEGAVKFLLHRDEHWRTSAGDSYLSLPSKRTVEHDFAPIHRGTSLEVFIDEVMREDLGFAEDDYLLDQELEPVEALMQSPTHQVMTKYTVFPVDVWIAPAVRDRLAVRHDIVWLTPREAIDAPATSPTARKVFETILSREADLDEQYSAEPGNELKPGEPRRILIDVPDMPRMDALALRWLSRNKTGVRWLAKKTLDEILDVGDRAFNLRVADPYLRYQQQGLGFTWSFFTHKDRQDTHVHSAPIVEIYGVLEGQMEIWWKPYHDRGSSAWNHCVLGPGDWVEVDSLQCHIVNWLTEGKGVVFKAGPGPLAEVGRLGIKGKTPCEECHCRKPQEVLDLEAKGKT